MVTKDIKVSYSKRFDTGGCAYDQMLSIRLKSAEMLKLEASIKETRQECRLKNWYFVNQLYWGDNYVNLTTLKFVADFFELTNNKRLKLDRNTMVRMILSD